MLELTFALLAGVLTIAAPCTLPMLPILLGASIGRTSHVRPAMIALGFVISFSATALLLGAITRLFDFDPNVLREAAAILLLGFVWTPCAGPVLGSILTLVATSKNLAWAGTLLIAYAIGAAIPMLAIAYGGQAATTRVRSLARISPRLQQGFGVVVIAFAVAAYFQYDTLIVAWLTGFYPTGQIGL